MEQCEHRWHFLKKQEAREPDGEWCIDTAGQRRVNYYEVFYCSKCLERLKLKAEGPD